MAANVRLGATTCNSFDIGGTVATTTTNGLTTTVTSSASNNYAAPTQVMTNSLSTSLSWTAFLGLSSQTGPNGDGTAVGYDGAARPATSTSPFGATTAYAYNDAATPPNVKATTNGHWAQTSMDGFGRTIQATTGDAGGAKSNVDTNYAACGCSPLGKMYRVSQPYAAGGSATAWTTYTYDGIGRTLNQAAPDGSATAYVYWSNVVAVTDAAVKWKQYAMDAFGNVIVVREPQSGLLPFIAHFRALSVKSEIAIAVYEYLSQLRWMQGISVQPQDRLLDIYRIEGEELADAYAGILPRLGLEMPGSVVPDSFLVETVEELVNFIANLPSKHVGLDRG